jgi:hypothetical protein
MGGTYLLVNVAGLEVDKLIRRKAMEGKRLNNRTVRVRVAKASEENMANWIKVKSHRKKPSTKTRDEKGR